MTVNQQAAVLFCKEQAVSEFTVTLVASDREDVFNMFLRVTVPQPEQASPLNQTESSGNETTIEEKELEEEEEEEEDFNGVTNADWWQAAFNNDESEEESSDD